MIIVTVFILFQMQLGSQVAKGAGTELELAYDNGNPSDAFTLGSNGTDKVGLGVHFTSSNLVRVCTNETKISRIRVYTNPGTFIWRIQDWNENTALPGSTVLASGSATASEKGWLDIVVLAENVPREFFIGIYNSTDSGNVTLYFDNSPDVGRARIIISDSQAIISENFLVRAVVDIPYTLEDIMTINQMINCIVQNNWYDLDQINDELHEMNRTLNSQLDNITRCCADMNHTIYSMNGTLDDLNTTFNYQIVIEELNATINARLDNFSQCCDTVNQTVAVLNKTIPEMNNTIKTGLNNLSLSCGNVSETLLEINDKIGEPSSTVFSSLEEISTKLDMVLKRLGLPVGGSMLPIEELKLVLEVITENLYAMIVLAIFGIIVTWVSVSFFGQLPSLFYCVLGIIGSSSNFKVPHSGIEVMSFTNNRGFL